jgi:hypothetical protein
MPEGLITVQITRNDTGELLKATTDIRDNLHKVLGDVGKMLLRNAQKAMDEQGPGWKQHAASTVDRYGDYLIFHSRPGKIKNRPAKHHLNRIRKHYDYEVSNFGTSAQLKIIPKSSFAAEMLYIHNRPRGYTTPKNIPGRPYFQWRTGHFHESEETQARGFMRKYVSDALRARGIMSKSIGFDISQPLYSGYDWGGIE